MVQETQWKIQERWGECEKIWEKINREMKNIDLLKFGPPEDFFDLHDIVKMTYIARLVMGSIDFTDFKHDPCQVKNFMEHPIKSFTFLQQLSVKIIKYKE
jgi:hypothetical protein